MRIEVWFEFASTYSYPAISRIGALAAENGIDISWCPFLLGPIFKEQGWPDSPFNLFPNKGAYMWRDLERICARLNIPFKNPSVFPRNGLLPARVACYHRREEWVGDFIKAIYEVNFVNDADISAPAVVCECLAKLGVDPDHAITIACSDTGKRMLKEETDRAISLGIFGAPTFIVDGELFWGNDRIDDAIHWCKSNAT